MNTIAKIALLCIPFGSIPLLAYELLRCRHRNELAARLPDGSAALHCADCGRLRAHPWSGEPVRYTRTLGPLGPKPTGIERMAVDEAAEAMAIMNGLASIEKAERHRRAAVATLERFQR